MGPLAEDSHGRQYDDGAHSLAYSTGSQDEETTLLPNQTHDMSMQGSRPNGSSNGTTPMPPNTNGGSNGGNRDMESYKIERNRSRNRGHRTPSGTQRVCKKCELPLTGQFVRALDGTFHLDCFRCADCGIIVASKFFPVQDDPNDPDSQYPLCETDYFRRLDLLCHQCGGALRGSYITALDHKYHIDHFTCSACPTVFGASDSYYEHDGQVFCHYHYSTKFAQRCNGCQTAILKQFVEIFRNGQNQHWHPECYMIHKFWNVRLASPREITPDDPQLQEEVDEAGRDAVRIAEEQMEEKVYQIWSVLSTFEESSAACISDMLLHVSNGAYVDGVLVAKKFICHVDILFVCADTLDALMVEQKMKGLSYSREAKLLCKKIVAFFALLSKTQETGVRKLGVTQELLSLVTGLAHYLKLLIRICLQGVLKVEREAGNTNGLRQFLVDLSNLEATKQDISLEASTGMTGLAELDSDQCPQCKRAIEDECLRCDELRWHVDCVCCCQCHRELGRNLEDASWNASQGRILCNSCEGQFPGCLGGFIHITRLQQYVFLLRVALARLLAMLRNTKTLPHTSESANLNGYNSSEGHRLQDGPPHLNSDNRSKSYGPPYGGPIDGNPGESSYENTLNDVRRLRSTRMDQRLSSTIKKARTSTIMDGPEGRSARPGSAGADRTDKRPDGFQIVDNGADSVDQRTELMFGHADALTLDDIPRIVAAEQAKEQRPNAYKHARHELFQSSVTEPKLVNGHQRSVSRGRELENMAAGGDSHPPRPQGKRYFSELTALEYFIVRHVAVLSMQPLLEGHFTLEELLLLIDRKEKPNQGNFWGKFTKGFKGDPRKGIKKKGVFKVPLDVLLERDGADSTDGVGPGALRIPALVDDCISTLRKMDLSVEGVFRKNGNIRRLNEAVEKIDRDGCDAVELSKENVVQIAALLKKFLRELPEPLLTEKLHKLFITSQKISNEETRRRVLHLTCCLLPKSHRDCLEILFSFLNWTASFHQVDEDSGSKMDTHNLATVIAPNILYKREKNVGMDDSFLAIEAVHSLIECNEQMCEVPEDLQTILNDSTLFENGGDITTKEILKRYGDIGSNGGPRHHVETVNANQNSESGARPLAPVFTRIDTDPTQHHAHQKESSARHVQDPSTAFGGSSSNQNMPPQGWQNHHDTDPPSPYGNSGDVQTENKPQNWRNSGWAAKQNVADRGGSMST